MLIGWIPQISSNLQEKKKKKGTKIANENHNSGLPVWCRPGNTVWWDTPMHRAKFHAVWKTLCLLLCCWNQPLPEAAQPMSRCGPVVCFTAAIISEGVKHLLITSVLSDLCLDLRISGYCISRAAWGKCCYGIVTRPVWERCLSTPSVRLCVVLCCDVRV